MRKGDGPKSARPASVRYVEAMGPRASEYPDVHMHFQVAIVDSALGDKTCRHCYVSDETMEMVKQFAERSRDILVKVDAEHARLGLSVDEGPREDAGRPVDTLVDRKGSSVTQ